MTTHVSENRIMDEILMKHPVPDNLLKAQKLDEESVHIQCFSGPYFIRSECGEIRGISPYSVKIWDNTE